MSVASKNHARTPITPQVNRAMPDTTRYDSMSDFLAPVCNGSAGGNGGYGIGSGDGTGTGGGGDLVNI